MAETVEPPLRGEPLFDEAGNPTIRFAEYLERSSDVSAQNTNDLEVLVFDQGAGQRTSFQEKFTTIELAAGSTALTTSGKQIIICKNTAAALVTLNTLPKDGEEVHIVRTNGPVSFIAAVGINGSTTAFTILSAKGAPHLIFSTISGEWNII